MASENKLFIFNEFFKLMESNILESKQFYELSDIKLDHYKDYNVAISNTLRTLVNHQTSNEQTYSIIDKNTNNYLQGYENTSISIINRFIDSMYDIVYFDVYDPVNNETYNFSFDDLVDYAKLFYERLLEEAVDKKEITYYESININLLEDILDILNLCTIDVSIKLTKELF
jgi:hypothetical protein